MHMVHRSLNCSTPLMLDIGHTLNQKGMSNVVCTILNTMIYGKLICDRLCEKGSYS